MKILRHGPDRNPWAFVRLGLLRSSCTSHTALNPTSNGSAQPRLRVAVGDKEPRLGCPTQSYLKVDASDRSVLQSCLGNLLHPTIWHRDRPGAS